MANYIASIRYDKRNAEYIITYHEDEQQKTMHANHLTEKEKTWCRENNRNYYQDPYKIEWTLDRLFYHYKNRLINECASQNPYGIRFNCIQYLCSFPGIDPFKMAASLKNDGYNILFDDTSISHKENAANKAKVYRMVTA